MPDPDAKTGILFIYMAFQEAHDLERETINNPWPVQASGDCKNLYVGPVELDYDDVNHDDVIRLARILSTAPDLIPALKEFVY